MSKLSSILLVEDDHITNFLNERLLRKLDLAEDIKVALNGKEALKQIQEQVISHSGFPELILLDINMPVMDGFEFLQRFKELPYDKKEEVTIVVLTTSNNPNDLNKLNELGNSNFVNKPLTEEKLNVIIKKYF